MSSGSGLTVPSPADGQGQREGNVYDTSQILCTECPQNLCWLSPHRAAVGGGEVSSQQGEVLGSGQMRETRATSTASFLSGQQLPLLAGGAEDGGDIFNILGAWGIKGVS